MTARPSLTITARNLRDLLAPVLPLAGSDHDLPVLCAVLLRVQGRYLTATTTDRFRVGICRHEFATAEDGGEGGDADFRALVRTADVRRVLSTFKPTRYLDPLLSLTVDGDRLVVESDDGTLDGGVSARLGLPLERGEYPKVDSIVVEALTADTNRVDTFGVNPAFLADFKHAARHGMPLVVRPGIKPSKPVGVMCGEHFVGAIMPRRVIGTSSTDAGTEAQAVAETVTGWYDALDESVRPKAKGKAA